MCIQLCQQQVSGLIRTCTQCIRLHRLVVGLRDSSGVFCATKREDEKAQPGTVAFVSQQLLRKMIVRQQSMPIALIHNTSAFLAMLRLAIGACHIVVRLHPGVKRLKWAQIQLLQGHHMSLQILGESGEARRGNNQLPVHPGKL